MSSTPTDPAASGFFSRWSQRKAAVRQAERSAEPPATLVPPPAPTTAPPALPVDGPSANPPPLPTLADVAAHDERSPDFSRFVAPGVDSGVRHAALRKLFSDPHFNVMDGLDIYIDDYGLADPIPPAMLRQMVQSHALGLFDHEKSDPHTPPQAGAEVSPATPPLAAPDAPADLPPSLAEPRPDENVDLRLQPDDAAGRSGPEPGPGQDAGR